MQKHGKTVFFNISLTIINRRFTLFSLVENRKTVNSAPVRSKLMKYLFKYMQKYAVSFCEKSTYMLETFRKYIS